MLNVASDNAVAFGTWWPRHEVCAEFAETPDGRAAGWWPMRVRFGSLLAPGRSWRMSDAQLTILAASEGGCCIVAREPQCWTRNWPA